MVDISLIDVVLFNCHMTNSKVEISTTSLYKIEHTIEKINLNKTSIKFLNEAIWRSLPAEYQKFQDVFLKQASDTIPPS